MTGTMNGLARSVFCATLGAIRGGSLRLDCPGGLTYRFGGSERARVTRLDARRPWDDELAALVHVHDNRVFRRALTGGDVGLGESYMDGDWTSPDLVTLVRLVIRNMALLEASGGPMRAGCRLLGGLARRLRDNTVAGSRRHIRRHYDLGNDFFRLFLDEHLLYSCACFESPDDTLERAQERKLDRICRALDLGPSDHVLEIGTGWGGFSVWAATRYGCHVTTTTISEAQYRHAREWAARLGEADARIEVLPLDYRQLPARVGRRFDKIVSIEMFEAVGLPHYDEYFAVADRLLEPQGAMLLQTITIDDQRFAEYRRRPDWLERYIFPGGEVASIGAILASMARVTAMSLYHAENIGMHYARTLHAWRDRFHRNLDRVRALGFDEHFVRMWDLYLASCEAAFLERHIGDFQLLLTKNHTRATMFNEPWRQSGRASAVA
jgi:cyclopropane-fatty-acyl-phospholipid synthase